MPGSKISAENRQTAAGISTPFLFDEEQTLHDLRHYLPAQAPLKDFIHHNTLHAFQDLSFHTATRTASAIFGYKVALSHSEYRALYRAGRISDPILNEIIIREKGAEALKEWRQNLLVEVYDSGHNARIGNLRANWKRLYKIDLDSMVHPSLYRIICSYLDQGIAIWSFPLAGKGLLDSVKAIERNSFTSFFRTKRARNLLLGDQLSVSGLLDILVGNELLYKQYLFDQQFAHQGWSGMVSVLESQPQSLLDKRDITLRDFILLELLLEIDALDLHFGDEWLPLAGKLDHRLPDLFEPVAVTERDEVTALWQEAFEWSYYDQVLQGIQHEKTISKSKRPVTPAFQALFCIDDRECSLRRYCEQLEPSCETFGTPGFFGVEFFFQPSNGKFYTKQCPAPVEPKYLIKEIASTAGGEKEIHFTKHTHALVRGWLIAQTLGYWSAFKLALNIFKPSLGPATAHSFRHMDSRSQLSIEYNSGTENGLQVGFTIDEMTQRVEAVLKSIGLVQHFAPLIYVIGHGSSSVNNPHYAAYDCGACSGRPGSVNARVFSYMANHPAVRAQLAARGLVIPAATQFMGGLHDTARDEIKFYDETVLSAANTAMHEGNILVFENALDLNAKERARRFELVDKKQSLRNIHAQMKKRSVSLFEPRPELNHATNALTIIGRRELSRSLFLDRRSLMNSYDYSIDPQGDYLFNILKAAAPVCGGINLEYFFSRVDNQKLGAGTKLPHNVMGLIGVANGIEGDLRPGLPNQMIELHDPVRMLFIVEHFPAIVAEVISRAAATYEWFINEWAHLVAVDPNTKALFVFRKGVFEPYYPLTGSIKIIKDVAPLLESQYENAPVYLIGQS